MNSPQRTLLLSVVLAVVSSTALLAQKGPSGPGSSPTPGKVPSTTTPPPSGPTPPLTAPGDLVLFITGKVSMDDGTALPDNVLVDRVCNGQIRQQVHTDSKGNFTFQLGSRYTDVSTDVSVSPQFGPTSSIDPNREYTGNNGTQMGVSRQALWSCEIKGDASGFRSAVANISSYSPEQTIDVGTIFLQRGDKPEGTTISVSSFKAPKDAKKAYDKAMQALKKDKPDEAQKEFEKAVQVYPQYALAWHQLGNLYDQQHKVDEAKKAYQQAITTDPKYVPPYLSMAMIAMRESNWKDVLSISQRAIDLDPLNYPVAYYFNSVGNYRLNNLQAAEKGARNVEKYDQQHRIPQVHLLLGTILSDTKEYAEAITEYTAFLKLSPDSKEADAIRAKVASLQKLTANAGTSD